MIVFVKAEEKELCCLEKVELKTKPEKYQLMQTSVTFLGHKDRSAENNCSETMVNPLLRKRSKTILGLVFFYMRFITNIAQIANLLHKLSQKQREPFTLDVVVSDKSMGAALSQAADVGQVWVIAYEVSADHARKRYCVTRKELLASVYGDWNSWMSISSMSLIVPPIRSRVENSDLLKYCQVVKHSKAYGSKQLKMVR
ncbi:hypothetical protein T11_14459 [Trichinella zimbabwensis]|uniref:Reverse transcriptase RNase H-like domain-containing protein n=1 Tax=Trichinella zimbabwensis TaxID=268475 RepID=A0A0V1HGF7_9BILA|nr:hypothetical protein T11_14459 [Trichinella zimbabwensis]